MVDVLQKTVAELLSPPAPELAAQYYDKLLASQPGMRIKFTKDRGKSIVATKTFHKGELILTEPPLAAAQDPANARVVLACRHCFRILGPSLEAHTGRAIQAFHRHPELLPPMDDEDSEDQDSDAGDLPSEEIASALINGTLEHETEILDNPLPMPVVGEDGKAYCSGMCQQAAWEKYQSVLSEQAGVLQEFEEFVNETNPVFAVVARMVAGVIVRAREDLTRDPTMTDRVAMLRAWQPLSWGQKALWWELPVVDDEAEEIMQERRALCNDAATYLAALFPDPRFSALVDPQIVGALVGMVELNNLAVVVATPAYGWLDALQESDRPVSSWQMAVARFVKRFGSLLDVEGTGFYRLHSCCNHSCVPNAHAFKRPQDINGNAIILALEEIQAGEEILLSYIDEEAPLQERQEALSEYGFVCTCVKCRNQQ